METNKGENKEGSQDFFIKVGNWLFDKTWGRVLKLTQVIKPETKKEGESKENDEKRDKDE